jgi:hypothetical protein
MAGAARAAVERIESITAAPLRFYRALWAYQGSAWSALAAVDVDAAKAQRAAELLRTARKAAAGTTWLKEVQPLPAAQADAEPVDDEAVARVIAIHDGQLRSAAKFNKDVAAMLAGLAQTDSGKYKAALVAHGRPSARRPSISAARAGPTPSGSGSRCGSPSRSRASRACSA